ncbi:MAG: PD-(D/E)XK nuclease family protein [Lachnospiraceae bacterium]|nr:PD-(D/E)XK nuclease family protein [Lachnospiraceae bacterium]
MGAEKTRQLIKTSVRELVEFLCRSGDIDHRRSFAGDLSAMREGTRIHRMIQNRQGAEYTPEVPLSIEIPAEGYEIRLEGRADGIITPEDEPVTIDEIKGVYQDVDAMKEPVPVHLAQAKVYAYIYASQNGLPAIRVRMTYCGLNPDHPAAEEIRYFTEDYEFAALEEWFSLLIGEYRKWTDFLFAWRKTRTDSIRPLEFPYEYRAGQKELVRDVYRTILRNKILFLQAPTGVGKTIATVFPGIKAMGEGEIERIFYLTAKTITAQVAMDTFSLLASQGLRSKRIRLTAKEKMCPNDEMECDPRHCPCAKGHFDRVNDAVFELLNETDVFDRETLLRQAEKHRVCPFEMSLDVSSWCDDIVCDYNYAFDPTVSLKRFFAEGNSGENLLLVDEAHNLVDRAREMFSATIVKEEFLAARRYMKRYNRPVEKALTKCNQKLLALKRLCDEETVLDQIADLALCLEQLIAKTEKFLAKNTDFPEKKEFLEFYFTMKNFQAAYDRLTENYRITAGHGESGAFFVTIHCLDPSFDLEQCLQKAKSTVFFSATMLPIQYYKSLLSAREDNYAVYADSSFRPEQRLLLIGNDVTTKYTRRTEEEYRRIAAYLRETVAAKKGNYLAFFPSYRMMNDVKDAFEETAQGDVELLVQRPGMKEEEREAFLMAFDGERADALLGFCVMGGIFGEGIDLTGEKLIGVIVVGTGIPQVGPERELLKDFFDGKNGAGFDYAYRYPGMNKVQQAAGRVIRTASDRGVILLLDERFLYAENKRTFPREWADYKTVRSETVGAALKAFWERG